MHALFTVYEAVNIKAVSSLTKRKKKFDFY